jgi:ligand-binding sensor domain-containing protein/signal transduction histidine kinase
MKKRVADLLRLHEYTKGQIFIAIILFIFSSCSQNPLKRQNTSIKTDSVKSPVNQSASLPKLTSVDTCPTPRKVIIPTKPGGFVLRKSDIGLKRIQYLPPENKPAGRFVPIQNFNTGEGLALGSVYNICEDKNGNLWFGTGGAGVSRYDGKSFTTFTVAQGLAHNFIYAIYADKSGNVWFGSIENGGVSCYDGKTFTNYTTSQGLASNSVTCVIEDRNGNLWFATGNGLSRFDPRSKSFKNFTTTDGLPHNNVQTLLEDRQGNIWVGCRDGIARLDQGSKSFTVLPAMAGKVVFSILEDRNGNFFFGCYGGLYYLSGKERSMHGEKAGVTEYTVSKGLPSSIIANMVEDRTGKIWMATYGGLCRFDPNTNSFKSQHAVFTNYTKEQGLPSNNLLDVIEDLKGNIWIASNGGGVSRLDQGGRIITTYTKAQGLAEDHIISIFQDKNRNIWFGTEGGISRLDREEKSFKGLTTAQGLVDYWVFSIVEDKKGDIWFCTQGDGVSRMDRDWKTITTYSTAQGLASNFIIFILEDKNGNIWFGSNEGVSRFDGKTFTNYTREQGLVNNMVREIIEDKEGNLWIATDEGISRFNLNGKSLPGANIAITNFTTEQGLANNSIKSIMEDNDGNLWVGTYGGGYSRYDGKTFLNFTVADGLADDNVHDIVEDKQGNIWLGTNKGLTVLKGFNRENTSSGGSMKTESIQPPGKLSNDEITKGGYKPVFEIYHTSTGYPIKDIYWNSLCVSANNILWAGTGENLVRFDYSSVYKDPLPPKVFIQNLKVNNEKIPWNNLLFPFPGKEKPGADSITISPGITEEVTLFGRRMDEKQRDTLREKFRDIKFDGVTRFYPLPTNLALPYHHNNVTLEFAGIETAKPTLVKYQYMLEGYDNDWSPVSSQTTATFGNIHEGSYTFKVKARSPEGVWSEPVIYTFRVLSPWYRTWWAYALYILAFSGALGSFIRWRISALKKEKVVLEEKVTIRTHELQAEKEKVETTLTELRDTQVQLIQREKMASLGELTAGIAHEIQNPLNFVNNFSETSVELIDEVEQELDSGNVTEAKQLLNVIRENEQKINHHGKRADAIVKGMLQHSRASTGKKEPTNINVLADEYLHLSYQGLRAKDKDLNVTIKTDFDESTGNIKIARQDIGRVLLNLYNNAFYAVVEKKKAQGEVYEALVTVSTRKAGDRVEIRVADNGTGISQKAIDKVFQPFFTTKPTGQGTGLGLSLSYDIIKAHGGEIKVDTKEGQGSEFMITLNA